MITIEFLQNMVHYREMEVKYLKEFGYCPQYELAVKKLAFAKELLRLMREE